MRHIKTNHFEKIAKNFNVLTFGDEELLEYKGVMQSFNNGYFLAKTEYNREILTQYLVEYDVDVLVLAISKMGIWGDLKTIETIEKIVNNTNIKLITILRYDYVSPFLSYINDANQVIFNDKSEELFRTKLYTTISTLVKFITSSEKNNEVYLDIVNKDIIELVRELNVISDKIEEGDLSNNVFDTLKSSITKTKQIIHLYNNSSEVINEYIVNFERFVYTFDKESVSITNIGGFTHLSHLLKDTATFLDNYFIEKTVEDIYVVEDSLKNSLQFTIDVLQGKEEHTPDLDIF